MKKKIWLPLLTVGATVATVTPIITSCRPGLMGTHDMLNSNYLHHVLPTFARKIIGQDVLVNEYAKDVKGYTDIIKDDILYTYSKILTTQEYKDKLDFDFTRYFLYVDDIEVKDNDVNFTLWAEITGKPKASYNKPFQGKVLRDFTIVIGAKVDTPLTITTTNTPKHSEGVFKDNIEFTLEVDGTKDPIMRTYIAGVIGLSDTTSGDIKYSTVSIDETSKASATSENKTLFSDLVYLIPARGFGKVESFTNFIVESYYFKNVEFQS